MLALKRREMQKQLALDCQGHLARLEELVRVCSLLKVFQGWLWGGVYGLCRVISGYIGLYRVFQGFLGLY